MQHVHAFWLQCLSQPHNGRLHLSQTGVVSVQSMPSVSLLWKADSEGTS